MNQIKILFLCRPTRPGARWPRLFSGDYAEDRYEAYRVGLEPREIHPLTTKAMDEISFDISGQYSKALKDYMGKVHFGYLITVCSEADEKCPTTFPGMSLRLHWDFEDPAKFVGTEEEKLRKIRQIRDQIRQKMEAWADSRTYLEVGLKPTFDSARTSVTNTHHVTCDEPSLNKQMGFPSASSSNMASSFMKLSLRR